MLRSSRALLGRRQWLQQRSAMPLLRLRAFPHVSLSLRAVSTSSDTRIRPQSDACAPIDTHDAPEIALTAAEANLFDFLVYVQHLYAPQTQLRVAGGWVRDKLRGAESEDIDVALDNVRGKTFASFITKFQQSRQLPTSSVYVVKANSEKSKHLEVATVAVAGHTVDLVHLRAEEYTTQSRVPEVSFATPEDDASRRDLTINALFYNLHTREVEDFTGRGLQDLRAGVIRTPREPVQTFLDDPLRVLRAVRFACAFGFTLDPALADAVWKCPEISDAMGRKVSRERIGIEMQKTLSGKDPARGFHLLAGFNLLDLVFNGTSSTAKDGQAADVAQPDASKASYPYAPREWTKEIQTRALHHLQYLQRSRLALANHEISFVESSAAILTPLFLSSVPSIAADDHESLTVPTHQGEEAQTFEGVTEQQIVESALEYVVEREKVVAKVQTDEITEMLKVHVKWPKMAAKRVALIIEAVATFPPPPQELSASSSTDHRLKRFMWMTRYNSVVVPALTLLVSTRSSQDDDAAQAEAQESMLKTYVDMAAAFNKRDAPTGKKASAREGDKSPGSAVRRPLDGHAVKAQLGRNSGPEIARALSVMRVWEMVHPTATEEDELAFLARLVPQLQ